MAAPQKLGLVIPTLNEEQNLVPLLQRLHNVLYPLVTPYEILIVDGGSTDRTLDFARDYAKGHAEIKVLSDPRRSGLAAAVVHGWQNTSAPFLGAMDADLQHPPELVPALLSGVIQGADLVIASRYVNGKEIAGWSPLRRIASRLGTRLTAPLLPPNLHLTDPLSGFFILRRSCIEGIPLQVIGFKILLEIIVCANVSSAVEVPFEFGFRQSGESKATLKVGLEYLRLLMSLRARKRMRHSSLTSADHVAIVPGVPGTRARAAGP